MKKRILSLSLALLMALALLPFGALAADLSPYAAVIEAHDAGVYGTYYDLNGDQSPELLLVWNKDGAFATEIYTLSGGKAEQLMNQAIIVDQFDYRFLRVLRNAEGTVQVIFNDQYSAFVGTDDEGNDWYDSYLRNQIYTVSGNDFVPYVTTEREELRTLPDENGDYVYIPDESRYSVFGDVSDDVYYQWMDQYYEEYEYVLDLSPDEAMDGVPAEQLLAAARGGFMDVPPSAFYAASVDWAVKEGITNGTAPLIFAPLAPCTRGQVVTFLWRAAGSPEPKSAANPFADVKEGAFYYKAVLWAVEQNITRGTSASAFSPGAPCTRGQVVTFLYRNAKSPSVSAQNPFRDVAGGAFYYDAVLWAVKNEITKGTSTTTFGPDDTCTRGQIVTFLYRGLAEG